MRDSTAKVIDLPVARPDDYLGPGHVTFVAPHEVEVEIRGGERVRAEMALSIPYSPVVGDALLVIGRGEEHYVIGVLRGKGTTALSFQGAVDLRASGGPITIASDQGVSIEGPAVGIHTGKLTMIAGAVVQRFTSVYQRVRDALDVHAGRAHTVVDDTSFMTAKNAAIVTEETMTINGDQIHLG